MAKPLPTHNKRNDGYVGILFFSLLCAAGGCALLYTQYDDYATRTAAGKMTAPPKVQTLLKAKASAPADAPPPAAPAPAPMP